MTRVGLLVGLLLFLCCQWVGSQPRQHDYIRRRMSMVTAATYFSSGVFNFTVPSEIFTITVTLNGASGGPSNTVTNSAFGGTGISIMSQFSVTPGEVLQIRVGGQGTKAGAAGYNGGGQSCSLNNGGSGGGATDVRRRPYTLEDRLVVAAGGGGSASASNGAFPGGNGGNINGGSSTTSTGGSGNFYGGSGGTSGGGGVGGNTCPAGSLGKGADCCTAAPGGAGGGGLYGGGAGSASGGGGGSSYGINGVISLGQAPLGDGFAQIDYEVIPTVNPSVSPSRNPSLTPSALPTSQPSSQPSSQPQSRPTTQPSRQPTTPTSQPSRQPTTQPSTQPSAQPSSQPTNQPSMQPSAQPSSQQSDLPTTQPSMQPSVQPSKQPIAMPTSQPSRQPSAVPTKQPSCQPSTQPSGQPSSKPSSQPTLQPSVHPSAQPSTQPTHSPTLQPTGHPSNQPSKQPSNGPSSQPTMQPSTQPMALPTSLPSIQPSAEPTQQPNANPSTQPSAQPSTLPTLLPTSQPSQQPSLQPTCQPTIQPSQQPLSVPTGQPSCQPTSQPSGLPSIQPSSHPSSQPSNSPSVQPSGQPSAQPSCQPSQQPNSKPSTQPSGQPTSQPSTQPSLQPLAEPTSYPTLAPTTNTGEWGIIVQNMSSFNSMARVQNTTWLCSEERSVCIILTDVTVATSQFVESSAKCKFSSGYVTSVLGLTYPSSIIITNKDVKTTSSAISKCSQGSIFLSCNTQSISNANFTDASHNIAASHIVYIGKKDANVAAIIIDASWETMSSYYYTTNKANSIYFLHVTSVPGYYNSFVAGTCVDPTNTAQNNIIAGSIRSDNGAMGAMIIKPQGGGYFRNSAELVTSLVADGLGPDLIIAGGVDQNNYDGMHAYILRVNSVFRTFSYALQFRQRVENRRLSTPLSRYESVARGMVKVRNSIYIIVDNTVISATGNFTNVSVLELDAASGNILQQVNIGATGCSIFCTTITTTPVGFTIACKLTERIDLSATPALLLMSADKSLTFSKLPEGFVRTSDDLFITENLALSASDAQISTTSATIPTTNYQQTITGQASTLTHSPSATPTVSSTRPPTIKPTVTLSDAPTQFKSPDPTSQPSSSPTSAPSVSPQPTSQPSTATPTISHKPTKTPSKGPSVRPSALPTINPSLTPTVEPTIQPSLRPSVPPTALPTSLPSTAPTVISTIPPTGSPTFESAHSPTSIVSDSSLAPTIVHNVSTTDKNSRTNSIVPNFVIGVSVVAGVVAMLSVCFCYHRYHQRQKHLVMSQVLPSCPSVVISSPAQDTDITYVKLASLHTAEQRHSSSRSLSFTLSSLHSDEQSENEEEFWNSNSFNSDSICDSESSHSQSD